MVEAELDILDHLSGKEVRQEALLGKEVRQEALLLDKELRQALDREVLPRSQFVSVHCAHACLTLLRHSTQVEEGSVAKTPS